MNILRILFLIISIGFFTENTIHAQDTTTYYVTKTGEKYHKSHCHYLKYSKYAIKVSDVRFKNYAACKVCRPPIYSENTRSNTKEPFAQKRCSAITKAGARCKRTAEAGSNTCWQHL